MSLVGTPFYNFFITRTDIFKDNCFEYLSFDEWWNVDKALDGALIEACVEAEAYECDTTDENQYFIFFFLGMFDSDDIPRMTTPILTPGVSGPARRAG